MRRELGQQLRAHPADAVEAGEVPKSPAILAICHDPPCESRPDAGESGDLGGAGPIEVHRTGRPAPGGRVGARWRPALRTGEHRPGWRARRLEQQACAVAGGGEQEQEQQGAPFAGRHAATLAAARSTCGTECMRTGAQPR